MKCSTTGVTSSSSSMRGGKKFRSMMIPPSSPVRTGQEEEQEIIHSIRRDLHQYQLLQIGPPPPLPKTISCVWHMLSLVSELENNNVNVINSDCTSCSGTLRVKGHFTHWTSSQSILTQQPLSYSPTRVDPSLNTFLSWGWTGAFWEIIKHRWKG